MTATTKSSSTPRSPWPHARKTTTPHGIPKPRTPASVGQSQPPPRLTPNPRSPLKDGGPRSPSPNYFGLIVDSSTNENPTDSNAGQHAKKNWRSPSSSIQSKVTPTSPVPVTEEQKPEYEEFRRQSEAYAFSLNSRNFSGFNQFQNNQPTSPLAKEPMTSIDGATISPRTQDGPISPTQHGQTEGSKMDVDSPRANRSQPDQGQQGGFFDIPRNETPESMSTPPGAGLLKTRLTHIDDRIPRLSLPQNKVSGEPPQGSHGPKRAETLPASSKSEPYKLVNASNIQSLLDPSQSGNVLLLDLRVSPQYSQSHLKGALNLCIPTTLLKRPSFNVQRLTDSFADQGEKAKFSKWKEVGYIIVYDSSSTSTTDAVICTNTLKKFTTEGYKGQLYIISGGFKSASKAFPQFVEQTGANSGKDSARKMSIQSANSMPVAGGCPMPATKSAANPFFGNIRQNMDLIGGVGQAPIKLPSNLGPRGFHALPTWLRNAAKEEDNGKDVSERFLSIEKEEQSRMQKALSAHVSYGTPMASDASSTFQMAGIEKGTKNRYKDILPYEHTRVRLQNDDPTVCDYVNASHVKAEWTEKQYIAAQAPVPATFEDFWRVVWEQNVRVVVMLTAEMDGNQRKCHPYWVPGNYGPLKIKHLSEKKVSLQLADGLASSLKKTQLTSPVEKIAPSRRRATINPHNGAAEEAVRENTDLPEPTHVTLRTLALSHSAFPFQQMREITQVQYTQWPDFGTPANSTDLLALVEHTNSLSRHYREGKSNPQHPASRSEPPILVHCSAGCGRTGTFCTIDSVIDLLKRQRMRHLEQAKSGEDDVDDMDVDAGENDNAEDEATRNREPGWIKRDDIDLVEKVVDDFRLQRLSMVQTLRQFVLCYESVLEWLVREVPERFRKDAMRRSFQG